jgi:WD40 repeat protein
MLWSVQSGKKLRDLPQLRSSAYDVVWSNDGTRVFVACGEGVRCIDVASGALLEGLADDLGSTACVAVHGNLLATGGYDHTVALWAVDSGDRLAKLAAHHQAVSSLAISLDGKLLWSAGNDGELRTWDLARLESAAATKAQADKPWTCGLEIAADGRFAVSIGTRYSAGDAFDLVQGKLVVWDARRGVALRSVQVEPRFGFDVSVSDDLKVCASAGLGGVRLWNFDDLSVSRDLHCADEHEFCTVAISPDGRWLVAGGRDRPQSYDESALVLLWDLRSSSPAPQRLALSNRAGEVFTLGFSHDGQRLAIARGNWDQGSVDVWSLEGDAWQESDVALTSHEHMAFDAAFLSDAIHLASTGSGGEVAIAACGERQTQFAVLTGTGFSIAASPDDTLIALGGNGQICLWDRLAEQQLAVIPINSWANCIAFTPDGEALVWTGGDGSVHWELNVRPLPSNSAAP